MHLSTAAKGPGRRILIVTYRGMGSITAHIRGYIFVERFREEGWTVQYADVDDFSEEEIVELAAGCDLVYLLKIPYLGMIRRIRQRSRARIVFDLTDALWQPHHRWNKWQDLEAILGEVDAVFSDNDFVAAYGKKYNDHVYVIPACTQVERFDEVSAGLPARRKDSVVVGWIGTHSTMSALEVVREPLERLSMRHPELTLRLLILGFPENTPLVGFDHTRFTLVNQYDEDAMIREALNMDIGIFPPPIDLDDYAIRGPLKALIYMTAGVVPVCANAGVCARIIRDGKNGMLATAPDEWERKLEDLIVSPSLRERMGRSALATVREKNSLAAVFRMTADALNSVLELPLRKHAPSSPGTETAASPLRERPLRATPPRRVLIACSHFWPSVGGVETRVEHMGAGLVRMGYQVDVITQALPERDSDERNGVRIFSIGGEIDGQPAFTYLIRKAVLSGEYAACILIQDPLGQILWAVEGVTPPAATKLILQPIINEDGYGRWKDDAGFKSRLAGMLKNATAAVAMTRCGPDMRFMLEQGVTPVYIPNATAVPEPKGGFRRRYGIYGAEFVVLHVANLYWVKNHLGLIDALGDLPAGYRLVMVGRPSGEPECAQAVLKKLRETPRVLFIPGMSREEVSGAMEEADLIVLASHGEGSPNTILEAMAHGKPWIATPQCGAANENSGGIVCPIGEFRRTVEILRDDEALRNELGEHGLKHWQACLSWPIVLQGWADLIDLGRTRHRFAVPAAIEAAMSGLRKAVTGGEERQNGPAPAVSVIVPTQNRPEMLKETIRSILAQTLRDFEIIVVNDGGPDVSGLLQGFDSPAIKYIQLETHRGVSAARNAALKAARGKYIAYLDDDDIFYPDHLETLFSHLEASDCRIAYSDSLQATQELIDGSYRVVRRDLVYSQDFDYDLILMRNFVPILCFMHERSIMDEVGFFDEELTSHEDWDLWVRISRRCRMDHIAKVTSEYRWREDGSSATSSRQDDYYRTARMLYEKIRRSTELPTQIINKQEAQLRIRRYDLQRFHPEVLCSIIMPVFNKVEVTRLCVEALYANTPHEVFELIIIDDASEDGTAEYLATLNWPNVKIISNRRNAGYTAACNQGAAEARGEFLVFLGGAEPRQGWLHRLVLMAGEDLRIGAVGPKLIYPDGRLDEAGGLIFSDGSIRSIGNGENPKDPRFNSPSMVDYCTGACLMVRHDLFREVGGFDERYAATCYEAADLCLAIAKLGYYVVYSPQSEVIRHEQAGPGFTPVTGADKPCFVDREKFVEKWRRVLKGKAASPEVPGDPSVTVAEVTIVIPVFNGADLTENCLRAIAANTPKGMYRVVVVDNGSKDGTRELLERLRTPEITVISNAGNLGFAKACNQGAQAAGGEFILFLNNDTLPHPGWLEHLVAMARQDAAIGVLGSKLLYPDDRVQHAGVVVGLRDGEPYPYHVHLCEPSDSPLVNVPREYQMVTGACLMIRSGLFRQVGGFDEAYVNGHEDLDLCMKVRSAGAKVMYCPASVVTHLESRTKRLIGLEQFHYEKGVDNEEGRGRRRFLERWRETLQIDGGVLAGAGDNVPVPPAAGGLSILFTMYGWNETGGGTTFPRSVALELARQGHRVSVFYASLATDPARPAYALETSVEEGVRLYALYNRPARFTDPDHPEREIRDEGVLRAFREVLRESAPDVVHFHNFHGLTFAMAEETRRAGIPSVYTPHNYHMIDPDLYLFNSDLSLWNGTDLLANSEAVARNPEKAAAYRRRIETTRRLLNEWVDVVLSVSSRQKELLVDYGAAPERIAVVHQASRSTDLLWEDPALSKAGARRLEKPLRFGFIGGVMPHKGVHMLVGAAQLFQPGEAEFHVYGFVSNGYLEELRQLDRRGMVVFHGAYGEADLPAIAAGIDVAVVPSVWEDCAPLVLLELMALRLPIIGARIGGIPDFVSEGVNGFLYRHDSLAELVACLRRCAADPAMVTRMRESLASPHSFHRYLGRLQEIYRLLKERKPLLPPEVELRVRLGATQAPALLPAVVWEGSQFVGHSLALVNRELCLQLIKDGYPLSIIPYEEDEFGAEADPRFHLLAEAVRRPLPAQPSVHVRHQWPPDFTPPRQGRWVMIQPWEFGSLPVSWVEPMNEKVDEVWVPSSYVRDCYLRSGVRPERVFTVPNGVDTALFNPQAPPIALATRKRFKFLFVGGTIARKGIDILLQAYSAAFTSSDDVCLVIKDMGGGSFYQGRTAQELIARYRQNPELPEVEYLDRFLPERELAGLYTACDCLVHPYRGEGFGLPMAEAMACGLPAVVTGYGAALDFCSAETAYLIPAREVKLPMKQVGELETVDHPWLAEPDAAALADIMRHVAGHPDEARERGRAAARHIAGNFTWEKAAACVRARLAALSEETAVKPPRHEVTPARLEGEPFCSIVIEAAGSMAGLQGCLDSIARHTRQPHEVLLVHDAAQDVARLERLAAMHGDCRLVDGGTRREDADPRNAGIAEARGDVLVLMEQNVVVTPGWLADMLACLEQEAGAGIVGPMGDGATGLQRAQAPEYGAVLDEYARSYTARHARRRMPARTVDSFCMLLTREALEAAGELDARLRRGDRGEDLCLRAALAGFRRVVAGDVFLHRLPSPKPEGGPETGKLSFREKWALGVLEGELAKRVASLQALFRAQQLARRGSLDAAVDIFLQQGIALAPTEPAPYLLLAEALLDAASFQNALEVLEQVPAGAELERLYLSWRCRSALGQEKEALALTEAIVRLAPETSLALYLQGKAAAGKGDAAGAETLFRRSCQTDPGFAPPWLELALLHRERGESREALDLAEKSFILAPLQLAGLALYHRMAEELSELPREEERVREACLIYPEHKGLCFGLIEVLIRQGRYLQAMEEIERAAVSYGLDDAALDAALEIRRLAGPAFPDSPCRAAVSVCMIVKDERRHLPAALASVKPFAAEIVVVDTGSTDRSGDLARLFGARVFAFPWTGDFSEARNVSLSKATGEWILVLDADEVLAARDLPRLKELLSRPGCAAFSITTRNYTAEVTRKNWTANAGEYAEQERGLGWTPSPKVRLFPNDDRVRFEGAVHELVEGTLSKCGIPVLPCDIPVHHYGKLDEVKCAEKKEQYYLLGMKKLSQGGATIEALTELAIQATELERFPEAEELWRRVLELTPEAAEPYFNLGYLYLRLGDYKKARQHALKGSQLAPEMKEAAFNLAKAELFLGNTERASAGCRDMLLRWPEYPPALSLLCVCRLLEGEAGEAEAIVRRLTQLGYDCVDFLTEYAAGLTRGERGDLAAPVRELAQRLEQRGSAV